MEYFGKLSQQVGQVWQGMSPGRRLGLLAAVLMTAATVVGVGYWATQSDYRVLYTGLAPEDAGAITSKLQTQGITYRLAAGGTSILVPAEQLQQLRVELAADGLPSKGGKGFELFDQSSLGMTPFSQHVNYLRALQAELARTIMQIDPVVHARVHIARPDPTPFLRDQKPPTASVVLHLRPGTTLSRHKAAGIVGLVARSVEGLSREHIIVMDTNGRVLSEEHNSDSGHISSQMDYRRELENYLSSRAETMLAQVVGPGRALVRVTADINFQRHREKKETYNPEGRVSTSEKITTSKATSSSAGARGPAGTASNLGKNTGGPGSDTNKLEETIQTDFVVSKVTQEFEDKMGAIERLTIAALVDLDASPKEKEGSGSPKMSLNDVQEIIKQAVGYKSGRDEIKVNNAKLVLPEVPPASDETWERVQTWQNILQIVKHASMGMAALAGLAMVWMIVRSLRHRSEPDKATESKEQNLLLERLPTTAQHDPQVIAKVLTSWLEQPERSHRLAA